MPVSLGTPIDICRKKHIAVIIIITYLANWLDIFKFVSKI